MTEEEKLRVLLELTDDPNIPDYPDFTDDEWNALCEEVPMTFEIFVSCVNKCVDGKFVDMYFNIIEQFPEYVDQLDEISE